MCVNGAVNLFYTIFNETGFVTNAFSSVIFLETSSFLFMLHAVLSCLVSFSGTLAFFSTLGHKFGNVFL